MSLYFDERVEEERNEEAQNDYYIKFCRSWVHSIPPIPDAFETPGIFYSQSFRTTSNIFSVKWEYELTNDNFKVQPEDSFQLYLQFGYCFFTYKLYSDFEMRSEFYSSSRIFMIPEQNAFVTPDGAMEEFSEAYEEHEIAKMDVFIEFVFQKLCFSLRLNLLSFKDCEDYPEDMDADFRFEFLKDSDFVFKCPDGNVPALKMVMNVTALKKYLKESKNDEFVLDHAVDVVQPIITYMHSECFEMPTTYTLDFADRFLKAIKFFGQDIKGNDIRQACYLSLLDKFIIDTHDFELILEWASLVSRNSNPFLFTMVSTTIALKYYYQWIERFPENTNTENQLFDRISRDITNIYADSLFTKTISFSRKQKFVN